jgi:plastocyanin
MHASLPSRSAPRPATRRIIVPATLSLLLTGLAWGGARADDTVRIDNFTFSPATLTVQAGSKVTWVNEDDIPHAVAASDRSYKSQVLDTDQAFSHTFNEPGSFEYFCSLHPHMKGLIVVVSTQ